MPKDATSKPETLEDALKVIDDLTKEVDEQKGHARTWEQRAKDNKDAAPERDSLKAENETLKARVAELETERDSSKTDVQKQLEKLAADLEAEKAARADAEKAAAADRLTAIKTRIGTEKGLPPKAIAALAGEDEESIAADADAWLEALPAVEKKPGIPGQGARGKAQDSDSYIAAIDAALPDREAAKA